VCVPSTATPSPLIAAHNISRHLSLTESVVVDGRAGNEDWTLLEEPFLSLDDSFEGVSFGGSLVFSDTFPSSFVPSFGLADPESKFPNQESNDSLGV
jgi:hypothetical protein